MRIMFAAWPSTTHIFPFVPIAWALRAAGHDVRVASYPSMTRTVERAGLTAVPLGAREEPPARPTLDSEELDRLGDGLRIDPADRHLWEFFRHRMLPVLSKFYPAAPSALGGTPMVDDLVAFARTWRPDLVIWDPAFLAAPVAARACGAAHARFMYGLDHFAWMRQCFGELHENGMGEDPLTELVRPMHERFGGDVDETMVLGQWTVDLMPRGMQLPLRVRSVPVRPVPYNEGCTLPDWLRGPPERPRVCLTLGLSARERSVGSTVPVAELLEMAGGLDADVVATVNADQLEPGTKVPENVRTIEYVPLNLVLETCSAIVHHGGPGTFCAAAAERVPQLVTGALSSWDNGASEPVARYVAERGAGLTIDAERFSVGLLEQDLRRLLDDPAFQAGANELYADMLATPSPAEIVPVLENLTAQYRTGRGE
jgi:glycosyltransferase (activator-dependent family)